MRNILLTVGYYVVVVPVGLLARLARDPLNRRLHKDATSYLILVDASR